MRINLRPKLLFFSVVIALVPLFVAGRTMIQLTQDELKSTANDDLSSSARQIVNEIDTFYEDAWIRPLVLVRNSIDSEWLGPQEKISILQTGLQEITDVAAVQLTVEGIQPALISKERFTDRFREAGLNPSDQLRVDPASIPTLDLDVDAVIGELVHVTETDDWLVTVFLPLRNGLLGRRATMSARIDLGRLRQAIAANPMNQKGEVVVIDGEGRQLLEPERSVLTDRVIVERAATLIGSGSRVASVEPYRRLDGEAMLGAYAFPERFPWGVVVEMRERDAYLAVAEMRKSLMIWIIFGLALATIGAFFAAWRISTPILKISHVAQAVSKGDLQVRVQGVNAKDEIGDLANRVNEMIQGLLERFNLEKFVSGGTIAAVKGSTSTGVKLGGERRKVTVFFSDIRGFTAFSERVEPEVVVEMLNTYLRHQAYIVKKYNGDIDKYVGDELVAVFQGSDMAENAVRCSVEIQQKMRLLTDERPEWNIAIGIGINTGDVVMGAMGSEDRMDYTILGDTVNLGARLCSAADRGRTIMSESTYKEVSHLDDLEIVALDPIQVKGKTAPIQIYEAKGSKAAYAGDGAGASEAVA